MAILPVSDPASFQNFQEIERRLEKVKKQSSTVEEHADTHASGGADPVSPASIGAATPADIATHTSDASAHHTKFTVDDLPHASTSVEGIVKLSTSTSSTSTSLAATSSAVKAAYDLANGKADSIATVSSKKAGYAVYAP
jgi:phage-related tail fiber protein